MRLKKIMSIVLCLAIVLGTMSFPVFAEETDLTISTADELKAFAADVNAGNSYEGKTVVLTDNINMGYTAIVIGTKASPFKGTFDGQGYAVSNISIYEDGSESDYFADSDDCIGLFGVINTPAVIKNVTVQDPFIVGSAYVGGIVGMGYTGTIENCHVTGEIDIEGFYMVGGINGHGYATISNCSVIGADGWDYSCVRAAYKEANLEGDNVGGIVGHNGEHNDIIGCEVRNITVSGTRKVGGIVGIAAQNSDVAGCKVSNVTVETTATAEYANSNAKTMSIGGLVGQYQNNGANDGVISGCEVSGLTFANENGVTVSAGALTGGLRGTSNSVLAPSETVTAVGNTVSDVEGATVEYLEPVSTAVAKVNGTDYASFDAAIAAAKGLSGDVTVEIYEKVTLTMSDAPLNGSFDSLNFVGMTDDAEIYLDLQGYVEAPGKDVSFEDLKLSKAQGGFIANAGFMNLAFGIFGAETVTYTDCTFVNGAYASAGENVFNNCTFMPSWDRYGFWAYGDADIVLDGCTFDAARGVKMYAEGLAKLAKLTVKNTDFSEITDKPAIVLTSGESVTLENNTYSSTGVFELDLDGVPNGTPVTSTDTITCVNDNGVCGVLVDGKIYTTAAAAAAVATAGSEVTLLHNSAETVEFAEGVVLNKNGFDAANVTVKTSGVAQVGDKTFASVLEAVTYAVENKETEVKLLADSREVMPTDIEIILKADLAITADAPVTAAFYNSGTNYDFVIDCEGYGDYDFTIGENVTFVLEDRIIWVGYYGSNIDVQVNGTLSGSQIWAGGDVYVNATGTLKSTGEAFVIRRGKTVFMDGGKIEANYFNILAGNIYAKNGAVIESGALWIDNTGGYTNEGAVSITLWDSTLTCQGNLKSSSDLFVYIDVYNSDVKILDNHGYGVSVLDEETTLYVNGESGSLTINKGINNSGTIDVYDGGKLAIPANATVTNNGDILIDATSTIEGPAEMNVATEVAGKTVEYVDGKYVVVAVPAVAKIGDVTYPTLAEAIAAAAEGDTITLISDAEISSPVDIAAGQNITLDLNGCELKGGWADKNAGKHIYALNNYGELTIKDSATGGKIVSRGIYNYGTLTLESGTIDACDGNGGYAVNNKSGSAFVMNGGTLIASYEDDHQSSSGGYDATVLGVSAGSTATLNGGTITNVCDFTFAVSVNGTLNVPADSTVVVEGNHGAVECGNGIATIDGGTFKVIKDGARRTDNVIYVHGSGKVIINGGTVIGDSDIPSGGSCVCDEVGGATINGGSFSGSSGGDVWGTTGTVIKGGTFENLTEKQHIAEGYELDANTGAVVKSEVAVAKIGDVEYPTLAEAIAAAAEGDTITILAGTIEEGTIQLPSTMKNVTIKGEDGAVLKDMVISAPDGNSFSYIGLTFDGITFDNSYIQFTGWRNGEEVIENLTVTNCTFKDIYNETSIACVHVNKDAAEPVNGFTFTNNVIDGATGGSKSGIYLQATGNVTIANNVINNVAFRPFVVQLTSNDGVADNFVVTGNTFSGSAAGRAQGLSNDATGTDAINLVVTGNIFKDITSSQQICYWNFNAEKTTADFSKNYYDVDLEANPSKIYFNSAAGDVKDLKAIGIYPIYKELNADGTINEDSLYTPVVPAAKIGDVEYATLEEAVAAAAEGDTITLLDDVTLTANLTLPAGITFNGNGKAITGAEVWAGGNLTFVGHTKVHMFNAGYDKPVITIGEGACLELTSTGRMVIGHGATFNITGTVADAKTANVADLTPSLIAAGASFTGAGVNFNVTNAYVKFTAYCSSKNSSANGTFNINVTNSIWNQTGSLVFTEPTNGKDPTFNFNVKDSVLNSTSHLVFAVTKGEIVFDNSNVNVGANRQLENRSTLTIKNGSVVYASVQTSSNAKNPGTTIVENATYNTTGEFSGSDVGTGTLIVKKGANVTMGKITKANIVVDATDMAAGDEVGLTANLANLTGTVSVVNNDALEAKVVDGKVVLVEKPVATVTDAEGNVTSYADLQSALKALTAGATLTLLDDVTITEYWDCRYTGAKIAVPVTIDGNGKTIKFTNTVYDGGNYMSAFRFEADAAVKNLTIDMSEALSGFAGRFRAISAMADLTVDNCKFIGNGIENNTRAIIFGEGAGANVGNLEISISNSTFEGWKRGVSDNENAQDVQSVAVTGNTFTNAGVAVSATDAVTFTNNTVSGAYVSVTSYTDSETLKVVATGNTLEANNGDNKNVIDVVTDDVEAQADFYLPNAGLAGSGTEADPFLINNAEELILFRDSVNAGETKYNAAGVYVALAADIDLAGIDWSVNIGDDAGTTFDGIFDGKNHKILNLGATENAKKSDGYVCTGLFGAIYGSAQIKNLTIENVNISAAYDGNNAGIVVGWVYNGTGSIENVTVTGDIKVDATGIYGAGAIVGYSYYNTNFTIKDCKVIANEGSYIKAKSGVGGIIGYSNGDNLVNCEVSGLEISANGLVGGIAGIALGTSNVATAKVSDVTLTASSANWANSEAVAIGTIATEGLSVSGVTYDNVNVDKLVGSAYAEKPTDVVPAVQAMVGNKYYTTFKKAFEAAVAGDTITLLEDVTLDEILYIGKSLTINGNGHTLASAQNRVIRVNASDIELTMNDLNVVNTAVRVGTNDIRCISLDPSINGVHLTLNNCTADFTHESANDWSYGVNVVGTSRNHVITINGGTYEGANAINVWGNNHTIVIDGATITSTYPASELYHGYCVNAEETGVEITIKNTTFNGSNAKAVGYKEGSTFVGENNIDNTKVYVVPVAKIGDTKYGTLEEAIAAAQSGDVITLIGDVEYVNVASASNKATSISIPAGKKFTLDLNGYTISGENNVNGSFSFITICAGADITIDDTSDAKTGKITYNATRETPNENHEGHTIKNMGSLTLNGGKIENSTSLASNGYEKCVTTAIDNVSSGGPIASFVMNGGVVVSDTYFAVRSNVYANTAATEKTAVTKINGGTVYGLHFCDWGSNALDYEVAIGDGAVIECGNYPDYLDQSIRIAVASAATSKIALDISDNAQINGVIYGAGAKNGNQYYTQNRLQTAFDEAQDGDTITLLGDITLKGKTIKVPAGLEVTLDLNGKKITGTDTNTEGNFYLIDNRGTLTVTGNGAITLTAQTNREWNASSVVIANNPGGKLTVENGTIEHLGGTDMAYALDNLTNGKGTYAETIVNGGTIKSTYRAVRQFLNGAEAQNILTINGGVIEGTNKSIFFHDPSAKANNGTLTVSENATLNGDVYLFVTAGSTEWPVEVSIAASAVNGNVTSKNVPEGYEVVESNGVYGVAEKAPAVAKIGDVEYATLAEAIAAAVAGDTVEILEGELDLGSEAFAIDKAITIKGAGEEKTVLTFDSATSAFVISSSNVTFEDMTIKQGTKSNSFHISVSKGAWDAPAIQYSDITIKNVDFVGGNYALCLIGEDVVVDSCTFTSQSSHNILVYSLKGDSAIVNNTFNASTGSNKSAILWEGGADNATDLSGFIGGGTLTIDGNTANAKGVFFQFTNWKHVKDLNVSITDNKIDAFTNKAIALYDVDGAITAAGDEFASFVVENNVFTNVPSGRPILKEYTGTVEVSASKNYLGSEEPAIDTLIVGSKVAIESYYSDEALTNLVTLAKPVAKIGDVEYASIQAAVDAAQSGDTITVIADVADEAVVVAKNVTIEGSATLTNVSFDAQTGCTELTVKDLTFAGNSWINTGAADKLTVSGVTANVTPSNSAYTNSRNAFISLGRNESKELELVVENSVIVPNSGANPILGWAAIKSATITGNTFGSETVYQNSGDSVKFMAIAQDAVITITGNKVYSNYNGIVFYQNTTRNNAYTVIIENNEFYGSADHIWIELSTSNPLYGKFRVDSNNTINGNAVTLNDVKTHNASKLEGYIGLDVVVDADDKIIGGTFTTDVSAFIADGYEVVDNNGVYGVELAEEKELFEIAGTTVSLDSSLALNIYWTPVEVTGDNYYAVVEHEKANGVVETIIPYADWVTSGQYKVVRYTGVAAKEMGDKLTITIYNTDDQAVSAPYVTSLRDYAINYMNGLLSANKTDSLWLPALTDMLNYGAAAQQMFGYKTDNLVNASTEAYQQYASTEFSINKDGCYLQEGVIAGTTLTLDEMISLNVYFINATSDMYATYSYTTHKGTKVSETVEYDSFISGWGYKGVAVGVAIADAATLVTVELYNGDGTKVGTGVYSVNAYLKGQIDAGLTDELYPALAKFAASAKAAFAK